MLRQVEPAVQGSEKRRRLAREQREWVIVEVKVQDVELLRPSANALQHGHVQRVGVAHRAVEAQRLRPHRFRVAAVCESPLANSVTSWPSATSSSVSQEMTRSVPP